MKRAIPLLMILASLPLAAKDFSFFDFWDMRTGEKFRISARVAGKPADIGSGQVIRIGKTKLSFRFRADVVGQSVRGDVDMAYLRVEKNNVLLKLQYKGLHNGKHEEAREIVQADAPLARLGILTFQYLNKLRFLQISRSSSGENKLITDWGAGTLTMER